MPCAKNMRGCHRLCRHRERIEDYYRARDSQLDRADEVTLGYEADTKAYFDPRNGVERRIVFKDWLIDTTDREEQVA